MNTGGDQNSDNIKIPEADFAFDDSNNDRLEHLDVLRSDFQFGDNPLKGLRVIVIGAGPAGLLFAKIACAHGAEVSVLEKAGDPRKHHAGYTNRSFNITLDDVGRFVLGGPDAWSGGIWLAGRALHDPVTNEVHYAKYADNDDRVTNLISIPRTKLRRNMVNQALHVGAEIKFKSRVLHINADEGTIEYKGGDGKNQHLSADLIIVGDGINSLGNTQLENLFGSEKIFMRPEPRSYVTARIRTNENLRLSLQHIHFWHEKNKEAYSVGIPNGDGSVSILLASEFPDFGEFDYPFTTPSQTESLLKKDFATLHSIAGDQLVHQLPKKTRGYFKYKAVPSYVIGKKSVLVGDSGCAVPPWAGFGANNAMYGAASLAYQIASNNNSIDKAFEIYQAQQLSLSRKIMQYVNDEGEFLSGPVTKNPSGRSDEKLCRLIKEAQQEALEQLSTINSGIYQPPTELAVSEI